MIAENGSKTALVSKGSLVHNSLAGVGIGLSGWMIAYFGSLVLTGVSDWKTKGLVLQGLD